MTSSIRRTLLRVECFEERINPSALLPGFSESVVTTGFASPTTLEIAPDGRIFVAEQTGQIKIVRNGTTLATPFLDLTNLVDSRGERGVLGVTFDPAFATNGFVYVYYTVAGTVAHNRVSRFTASGDTASLGTEFVLLELDNLTSGLTRNGGALHFGTDGKLYVAVGDNGFSLNSQTLSNRLGKILRINSDGTIPVDNPFVTTALGLNQSIWALGLRNPSGFGFDSVTGQALINDVGQTTFEEINNGFSGANFGWPGSEGPTTNTTFISPLFSYRHDIGTPVGSSISGGTFYRPSVNQFGGSFAGKYFFADSSGNFIFTLDPVSNTATAFATNLTTVSPVDLDVDSQGNLYYLARGTGTNTGTVYRISTTQSTVVVPPSTPPILLLPPTPMVIVPATTPYTGFAVGTGPGVESVATLYQATTNQVRLQITPYPGFRGGIRVATGDFNGDGFDDIVTVPLGSAGPHVKVFDGQTGALLKSFFAYDPGFLGGLNVATGDVNRDGVADIITGTGAGSAPHVKVFDGVTGAEIMSFFAFDSRFLGGVRVAAGDLNGDGFADVLAAPQEGPPHVRGFSGNGGAELVSFFAFDQTYTAGISLATGDIDGDGKSDILVGGNTVSHVKAFQGQNLNLLASYFAYGAAGVGASVASADVNGDGRSDIITGAGRGAGPHIRITNVVDGGELASFFAGDPAFLGGVFVGASGRK